MAGFSKCETGPRSRSRVARIRSSRVSTCRVGVGPLFYWPKRSDRVRRPVLRIDSDNDNDKAEQQCECKSMRADSNRDVLLFSCRCKMADRQVVFEWVSDAMGGAADAVSDPSN